MKFDRYSNNNPRGDWQELNTCADYRGLRDLNNRVASVQRFGQFEVNSNHGILGDDKG